DTRHPPRGMPPGKLVQPFVRSSRDKTQPAESVRIAPAGQMDTLRKYGHLAIRNKKEDGQESPFPCPNPLCNCYTVNGATVAAGAVATDRINSDPSPVGFPLLVTFTPPGRAVRPYAPRLAGLRPARLAD